MFFIWCQIKACKNIINSPICTPTHSFLSIFVYTFYEIFVLNKYVPNYVYFWRNVIQHPCIFNLIRYYCISKIWRQHPFRNFKINLLLVLWNICELIKLKIYYSSVLCVIYAYYGRTKFFKCDIITRIHSLNYVRIRRE